MTRIELLYDQVMHRLDMTKETGEEELQEIIRHVIDEEGKREQRLSAGFERADGRHALHQQLHVPADAGAGSPAAGIRDLSDTA